MLRGLALGRALPFVRQFYGIASEYLWRDDAGDVHTVAQAEGGEQGDPLMPGLFALGLSHSGPLKKPDAGALAWARLRHG